MKKGNFHVKLGCMIHDGTNHGQQMHNHVHLISLYKFKYFNNVLQIQSQYQYSLQELS